MATLAVFARRRCVPRIPCGVAALPPPRLREDRERVLQRRGDLRRRQLRGLRFGQRRLMGLTRVSAQEGAHHGILVNGLLPNAATRGRASVTQPVQSSRVGGDRSAELVAHAAAWLAHDQCSASGEFFAVKSGSMREIFVSVAEGFQARRPGEFSLELIQENWPTIRDRVGALADRRESIQRLSPGRLLSGYRGTLKIWRDCGGGGVVSAEHLQRLLDKRRDPTMHLALLSTAPIDSTGRWSPATSPGLWTTTGFNRPVEKLADWLADKSRHRGSKQHTSPIS